VVVTCVEGVRREDKRARCACDAQQDEYESAASKTSSAKILKEAFTFEWRLSLYEPAVTLCLFITFDTIDIDNVYCEIRHYSLRHAAAADIVVIEHMRARR